MARTELETSMKSIKYILLIITSMFIVVSALMITLGVSVYSKYHDLDSILSVTGQNFLTPSVLIILTGVFMLFITLFGFVGSLRESTCLVNMYALILIFLLFIQVVVIAIGFSADEDQIVKYVDIPVSEYANNKEIKDELDFMQSTLKCCGSTSYKDYASFDITSEQHTVVANLSGRTLVVPQTCCYEYSHGAQHGYCTGVWLAGCQSAIVGLIMQNSGVLGVLAMSVAFIQLLGIIFSSLLARTIRKVKSERAYLRWKLMEKFITSREEHKPYVYLKHADSTKA